MDSVALSARAGTAWGRGGSVPPTDKYLIPYSL